MSNVADMLRARAALDPYGRPKREQVEAFERAKAALNAEADANWEDPKWHREQAAIVAERLDYGFVYDNLFSTYFEVKNVGETDIEFIEERRGMKVFSTSRGGYIDETEIQTVRWELPRDSMGFHVKESEWRMRANYAETIEQLAQLAIQRFDAEVNRRMFTLLQASIPSTSAFYINAASGLTKAMLDSSITAVHDAVHPNNIVQPPVTILGRGPMIDQVSKVVTDQSILFDPSATEEVRRQGKLGVYRGANVIRINNYTDENDKSYIPANELWIFGGNVGTFVKYGGTRVNSWLENTAEYRHVQGRADVGGLVSFPRYARRIVDATVTP